MKHTFILITLAMTLLLAQEAKSQHKDKTDSTTAEPILSHYYKKYTLAIGWNDHIVARNALYDMIVRGTATDSIVFSLAYLYYEDQQYTSAALVCQDLLEQAPKNINYLSLSAAALEAIGALDKALQNYETLYLLSDDTSALYKVAVLQNELKRYAEVLTNIDILLTRSDIKTIKVRFGGVENPSEGYSMELATINLKGKVYEQKGDLDKAKEAYEQALALNPDFTPAQHNLAKLK